MKDERYYRFHIALKVDEDRELIEMMRVVGAVRLVRILWAMSKDRLSFLKGSVADPCGNVIELGKKEAGQ